MQNNFLFVIMTHDIVELISLLCWVESSEIVLIHLKC